MAGGKETPRQKMIGMMYLVLTALLALNVSKEILDAFITINNGLETTMVTFDGKLAGQYGAFNASYNENQEKYGDAWAKAQELRSQANGLIQHIDLIKAKTIADTEGLPVEEVIGKNQFGVDTVLGLQYVSSKDNYDVNTNLMIGAEPDTPRDSDHEDGNNYRATVLKQKLLQYGENLKAMAAGNPVVVTAVDSIFSYPEKVKDASGTVTNWESLNFFHVPLAATTTLLSKLQADVRNAESDVLGHLFADVEAASYKFTQLAPVVIPEKTYILEGDSFRAKVFLAAYDNTNLPGIDLGPEGLELDSGDVTLPEGQTSPVKVGADGFGRLAIPARGIGDKHWEGIIKFRNPATKAEEPYKFVVDYEVAKPSLVVSATKMNVLYRGIENPIEVSVPGIPQDALTATISTGSLSKKPDGSYVANVKSGSEAIVSVTAEIQGQRKNMGQFKFRLKSVPDPVAKFAGKTSVDNTVKKSELTAALGVIADLKDFVFDLNYPIRSFDIAVTNGADVKILSSSSNRLTAEQKELLRETRRNQTVSVENIKATAPDGTIRKLGGITLRIL
ncbi:MAG: GldM family protein [Cryomorphaceae bacterium]